jgi:POT family proton-dependent oligopeptide transporter
MTQRSSFPPVFWVANATEILERFAYYGIYFGFGIYMRDLGLSTDNLANVQAIFLVLSYGIPIFAGTLADRYGFKKLFIASYVAYLPAILMLLVFKSYYGILATMLCIGFAAGIFKPLVASTVRVVTDTTNKTLGFGIFYMMVNIGGFFGPIVSGHLRTRSWDTAHIAGALTIAVMFVLTLVGYREPPRERSTETLRSKLRGIGTVLADLKFASFLLLLGIFFWAPFWGFFNICALYIDSNLDTGAIYQFLKPVFDAIPLVGPWALGILSHDDGGVRKVLGESIGNTGLVIILLQVMISRTFEKRRALPSFMLGLGISAVGMVVIALALMHGAPLVLLGIALFAIGEMITSPRIQEYITWIAPKEKAGLYMGSNFIATMLGAFLSRFLTQGYGRFTEAGHPEAIWYVMGGLLAAGVIVLWAFLRVAGEFKEQEA